VIQYLKIKGLPNEQFNTCGVSFMTLEGDRDSGYNFKMKEHRYPGQRREARKSRAYIKDNNFHVYILNLNREFKFPIVEMYETQEEYLQEIDKYSIMRELVL